MTQEDKELLFKDLCARLPYYGLMVQYKGEDFNIIDIGFGRVTLVKPFMSTTSGSPLIEEVKPYLRPMSSMTEEEKKEMHNLLSPEGTAIYGCGGISMPMNHYGEFVPYEFMNRIIQYLLENHFDFMGLIPKGLAIEVTEENNPYKE